MARIARGHLPAGTYHVTTRTCGKIPAFLDDEDRTRFLTLLVQSMRRQHWSCRAFCLMTTHYHLLLQVPENGLQAGMRRLNGVYAIGFNRRHGRSGHLFGDRYSDVFVKTDGHLLHVLRYIARNPVRAGLCERPSDWYWGSYRDAVAADRVFGFVDHAPLLGYFGADPAEACRLLRAFVGDE